MNGAYHTAGKRGKKHSTNALAIRNASTEFNAFY